MQEASGRALRWKVSWCRTNQGHRPEYELLNSQYVCQSACEHRVQLARQKMTLHDFIFGDSSPNYTTFLVRQIFHYTIRPLQKDFFYITRFGFCDISPSHFLTEKNYIFRLYQIQLPISNTLHYTFSRPVVITNYMKLGHTF